MPKTPTVPELPEDDTALSVRGWQALLWLRLGEVSRKLDLVCLLLGILIILNAFVLYLLSH